MNKFAIPTILLATVMVAGMFAFIPVNQASTVHNTIVDDIVGEGGTTNDQVLDAITEITEIRTASFDGNDCKDDLDDGTLTLTLDAGTDTALVVGIIYKGSVDTDTDDRIIIDLNADGVEIVAGLILDDAPSGDTELLSAFDFDGNMRAQGDGGFGSIPFTDTFSIDIDCFFTANDNDYDIDVMLEVRSTDDLSVSAAIT